MVALKAKIKSVENDFVGTSTWGLFFLLLTLIGQVMIIVFAVLSAITAGVTITAAAISFLLTLITALSTLFFVYKEYGLFKKVKELREKVESLKK